MNDNLKNARKYIVCIIIFIISPLGFLFLLMMYFIIKLIIKDLAKEIKNEIQK